MGGGKFCGQGCGRKHHSCNNPHLHLKCPIHHLPPNCQSQAMADLKVQKVCSLLAVFVDAAAINLMERWFCLSSPESITSREYPKPDLPDQRADEDSLSDEDTVLFAPSSMSLTHTSPVNLLKAAAMVRICSAMAVGKVDLFGICCSTSFRGYFSGHVFNLLMCFVDCSNMVACSDDI